MRRSLLVLITASLILAACAGDDDADHASTIEAYVTAYNAGDIDGVMALFTDGSTLFGHPLDIAAMELDEIRSVQVEDMAKGAKADAYTISNVEVTGTTVTWDTRWTNNLGEVWCHEGHRAEIEDGKFLSWHFASKGGAC